jgi:hypothetical protein
MQKKLLLTIPFTIFLSSLIIYNSAFVLPAREDDQEWCWLKMVDDPQTTFAVPNIPRPKYLETIIDPVFGTNITRVTGDPGDPIITKSGETIGTWGDVARHHYSKDQPWNADASLIHITRNYGGSPNSIFLDGKTYEVLFSRSVPGDHRWHPTDTELKIYVSGNQIGYFNVRGGENTVIRTFSEYGRLDMGPYEGNLSYDGRKVVLYGDSHDVFAYDLEKNIKYPTKEASGIDWASISPLGSYVVIHYSITNTQVFDLNMNFVSRFDNSVYGNHTHFDLGLDETGEEVTGGNCKDKYPGRVVSYRLRDGRFRLLTTGGWAIHSSMRSRFRTGWIYSSTYSGSSYPPYRDEIISVKTDGTQVQRWCHIHNRQTDYYAEAQPVPSPDGKKVIFASNWGEADGRPVGMYVVDARVPCNTFPVPPTALRIVFYDVSKSLIEVIIFLYQILIVAFF